MFNLDRANDRNNYTIIANDRNSYPIIANDRNSYPIRSLAYKEM